MRTDPTIQSRPHHAPHLIPACDVHTSGSHSRSPRRDTSSVRMGRTLGGSSQGACSGGSLAGRCLYRKHSSPDTSAIALLRDHPAHSSRRCASDARADSNPVLVRSAGACTQGRAPSEAAPGATAQGGRRRAGSVHDAQAWQRQCWVGVRRCCSALRARDARRLGWWQVTVASLAGLPRGGAGWYRQLSHR